MDIDPRRDKHSISSEGSRKRRSSPSFDDYDDYPNHRGDPYSSSSKAPRHDHLDMSPRVKPSRSILDNSPPKKRRSYAKEEIHQRSRSPEDSLPSMSCPHPASVSPSEEESHEKKFIRVIDNSLQKDRVPWLGFFEAKGGDNRICNIVKQYEFLDRICATWVGKLVPGYDIPIEEVSFVLIWIYDSQLIDNLTFASVTYITL
jgi:hypothetical protein